MHICLYCEIIIIIIIIIFDGGKITIAIEVKRAISINVTATQACMLAKKCAKQCMHIATHFRYVASYNYHFKIPWKTDWLSLEPQAI